MAIPRVTCKGQFCPAVNKTKSASNSLFKTIAVNIGADIQAGIGTYQGYGCGWDLTGQNPPEEFWIHTILAGFRVNVGLDLGVFAMTEPVPNLMGKQFEGLVMTVGANSAWVFMSTNLKQLYGFGITGGLNIGAGISVVTGTFSTK